MTPHTFTPTEPGSPACVHCPLGSKHRVHRPVTRTIPAPTDHPSETVLARIRRDTDAAFREVWDSTGPRARVFRELVAAGYHGLTDEEVMARPALADMPDNTARPRRCELVESGLVVRLTDDTGAMVKRGTTSGRAAQVWVISTAARRLINATAEYATLVDAEPA